MNHYEILEIKHTATQEEIRIAYRKCAKKYHPDLHRSSDKPEYFIKMMSQLNIAYGVLIDPEKRKMYDLSQNFSSYSSKQKNSTKRGPYWDQARQNDNPFEGFANGAYEDFWQDMMNKMRQEEARSYKWEYEEKTFKRRKLSVVKIKRLLKTEITNKKPYTSYNNTTCDLCSNPINVGDTFFFMHEKQKMCQECQLDILSHL